MFHSFNLVKYSIHDFYQANELVSLKYREQIDLRQFDDKINDALMFVFGEDFEHVHIGPGFYLTLIHKWHLERNLSRFPGSDLPCDPGREHTLLIF